jgi:hypothetical protein
LDYKGTLNNDEGFVAFYSSDIDIGVALYPTVASYDLNDDGLPDTVFMDWRELVGVDGGARVYAMAIITEADTLNHKPIFTKKITGYFLTSYGTHKPRAPKIAVRKSGAEKIIESEGFWIYYSNDKFTFIIGNNFKDALTDLVVGDINGDGIEDVVRIAGILYGAGSNIRQRIVSSIDEQGYRDISVYNNPTLVLPNVETSGNELILKFKEHQVQFSNPRIIAVLTSPPYWEGSDNDSGGTSLGSSISKGDSESHAVGMSVGIAVGAEVDALAFGSLKIMAKIDSSLHKGWTKSKEITESVGDSIRSRRRSCDL